MNQKFLKTGLALALAGFAMSGAVLAQSVEEPSPEDLAAAEQAAIVTLVENFVNENPPLREEWIDLDKDGIEEAIVVLPPGDDGLSEWHVFGIVKGDAVDMLAWFSKEISFSELPVLRDRDGLPMPESAKVLIEADGLTFTRLRFGMEPTADLFLERKLRPRPATAAELKLLQSFGYSNARMEMAPVISADFLSPKGAERIISLNDEIYRDENQTTPYLILGADNTVLFEGRSTFHPWIYVDDTHGVQLVEDNGNSFSLVQLQPPTEE